MDASRRLWRVGILCVLATVSGAGRAGAQIDLSGEWRPLLHEDIGHRLDEAAAAPGITGTGGPWIGDYTGLPITSAARMKADAWDPRIDAAKEHQTVLQPGAYWILSPGGIRIAKVIDEATQRTVAFTVYRAGLAGATSRIIWMDGREAPPPYGAHLWQGFSRGAWRGDTLSVTTTHLKAGFIRRNGVPVSDRAVMTEHFVRHGSYLTAIRIVEDPINLEEPFVTTVTWMLDPRQQLVPPPRSVVADEVPGQPRIFVPHYLPGQNPFLTEFATRFGVPHEAARGGAATMYPEYRKKIDAMSGTPKRGTQ
jgi:hypothetical protein